MSRLLRTALTLLLVIALPAKGFAAASMVFCGPASHGSGGISAPHAHDGHDHQGHHADKADHAGFDPHPAEHSQAASHHTQSPQAGGSDAASDHGTMKHAGRCSICASCCSAAAISSTSISLRVVPPAHHYVPVAAVSHPGVTIGGLERPPKAFLA